MGNFSSWSARPLEPRLGLGRRSQEHTLEGADERLRVESLLRGTRAAIDRDGILSKGIDKVGNDKVLVGEVIEVEAGPLRKEGLGATG